jgi:NitT/TauT family transport system substrate-binding protein
MHQQPPQSTYTRYGGRAQVNQKGTPPAVSLMLLMFLVVACAPARSSAPAHQVSPPVASAASPSPATPAKPELPVTPPIRLNVGILPLASGGPLFIADARGYFTEVGLTVEFTFARNYYETLPAVATGQLQVAPCSSNVGCSNALHRGTDLRIVADVQSAGRTERSRGGSGLVVRKDLWDQGVIRQPQALVGRTAYLIAGEGTAQHAHVVRWLRRQGVDPRAVEWGSMPPADQLVAMGNRAIEVGYLSEPITAAALGRDAVRFLATMEEMNPDAQTLYLMYNAGIDRLGPRAGERFMVAYLRGARDQIDAFEYGIDQDTIINILTEYTAIKDPAVYRQIKYPWIDPNGRVNLAALQDDADLFYELGLLKEPVDLSIVFEPKYAEFAVKYLGEYHPPH